ncbi:ATP-binding cassette domain-containing protein [Campylobacter gastrosuis]|uniref:ATP-binding cassette domain-containing protein n=1 Tax=Campylobacter gastrosuis TaxID=2974576 RepID=A0ABT7HSU3_9BACT|nr:ATP-binding cassette domain-containing protein [Campylobacter gastrosuis]MDL0089965.1 ATP-binding cassette domain-containing protein [Campylobacter gastrosuis]
MSEFEIKIDDFVDIKFSLKRSKITALIGKSGSGKSLSAAAIFGFTPPNFKSSTKIGVSTDKIAMIMQNPRTAFNPLLTLYTHAKESGASKAQILEAFSDAQLQEAVLKKYPFELSGGMLQRAMIALSILKKPEFLIADEPTTDLDLIMQSKILELLLNLRAKKGLGILLITHDFGVVYKMADEILVMSGGKIVERGSKDEIFNAPKTAYTKELLGSYYAFKGFCEYN